MISVAHRATALRLGVASSFLRLQAALFRTTTRFGWAPLRFDLQTLSDSLGQALDRNLTVAKLRPVVVARDTDAGPVAIGQPLTLMLGQNSGFTDLEYQFGSGVRGVRMLPTRAP